MKNVYIDKVVTDSTSVDFTYNMPIYEAVRLAMRVALSHAEQIGLGHEIMEQKSNAFWIITKLKMFINNDIKSGQKLSLKTWCHVPELARCKRDYNIKMGGKLMAKGSMEWCCLDMDTHKVRKISSINYPDVEIQEYENVEPNYTNLREEVTTKDYIYTYTVRSTDIDMNKHTNNLKYNFMTINAFTVEELNKIKIKEYELYFVNESHEGDKIDIYRKRIKKYYYVVGKIEDKVIFKSVLKFSKIKSDN